MNETLTRIVADLLVKAKAGQEFAPEISRLRDELKKVIDGDDTIFGKLRGLVESFQEIIPEEKQRYSAAIKALSTTSKLSRQEIVTAVTNQIEELKILEKVLMPAAIPGDDSKAMEARLQELKVEIAKLRERTVQLENEEKAIVNGMATRGKALELVEKGIREAFATIAAEITTVKNKVDQVPGESAAPQPPLQQPVQQQPVQQQPVQQQPVQQQPVQQQPVQQQPQCTQSQKKCPMCGGRMDLHVNTWICYSCAYEELKKDEVKEKMEEKSAPANTQPSPPGVPAHNGGQESEPGESTPQKTEWQKKCPMCGGQMHFQISGNILLCYTCAYEEEQDGVQSKNEEKSEQTSAPERQDPEPTSDSSPSFATALGDLSAKEYQVSKKQSSSNSPLASKNKPCPVCRKKMHWYPSEKAWRCPSCHYERRI